MQSVQLQQCMSHTDASSSRRCFQLSGAGVVQARDYLGLTGWLVAMTQADEAFPRSLHTLASCISSGSGIETVLQRAAG